MVVKYCNRVTVNSQKSRDIQAGVHMNPSSIPSPVPVREDFGTVLRKIISLIGVHPSRNELIEITNILGWGPLTRAEKRVKNALIQRLETMRDTIIPFLDSRDGIKALQDAYLTIIKRQQEEPHGGVAASQGTLPPEASIHFYLNHGNSCV
jgi:hypothetical protein